MHNEKNQSTESTDGAVAWNFIDLEHRLGLLLLIYKKESKKKKEENKKEIKVFFGSIY